MVVNLLEGEGLNVLDGEGLVDVCVEVIVVEGGV